MTKRNGQNGPEDRALLPDEPAPSESQSPEGPANPPTLLQDSLVDRRDEPLLSGDAGTPEVLQDISVPASERLDTDPEADLPLVQGDRMHEVVSPDLIGNGSSSEEGHGGLSVMEDSSVTAALAENMPVTPRSGEKGLMVLEDAWKVSSEGEQKSPSHATSDPAIGDSTSALDESGAWGSSTHPLPAAIDLSSPAKNQKKGFLERLLARKRTGDVPAERMQPILSSGSADPAYARMESGVSAALPSVTQGDDLHPDIGSVGDDAESISLAPSKVEVAGTSPDMDVLPASDGGHKKKTPKAAKTKKTPKRSRGNPPIQVIIGWIAESNRKDVIEHARGFAADHIETLESAWITVSAFRDGHIFEVHEGGSGLAYMPEIIEQLTRDPDQVVWVPSGTVLNRVLTIRIAEDQIFSTILTEAESALVRSSGQEPLNRTGRMVRLVPKGTGVLAAGVTLATVGALTLMGAGYYSALINQQPLPSRTFNPENLPHSQIIRLSEGIRDDRWVSRIVFEDGQWRADFETVKELVLPVDDAGAQAVIDDLYKEEERIKKAVEESIEKETAE